jgi:hypothetical protein
MHRRQFQAAVAANAHLRGPMERAVEAGHAQFDPMLFVKPVKYGTVKPNERIFGPGEAGLFSLTAGFCWNRSVPI